MSSSAAPNPPGPDTNEGPSLMALYISLSTASAIFMVFRLASRWTNHAMGIDDWSMLLATLCFIGAAIVVSISAENGYFRHIWFLDNSQISGALKYNFALQPLVTMSEALGKSAIALLLLRIIGITASAWRKYFLWMIILITMASGVATVLLTFLQCQNPQALWNPALKASTYCVDQNSSNGFQLYLSTWYTIVDFLLALFPIIIIRKLQMSLRKKIALCFLLGLGILTGIFSAIKTAQIVELTDDQDPIYDQYTLIAYAGAEEFLMICLGSIPTFRGPYEKLLKVAVQSRLYTGLRNLFSTHSRSRNYTSHSGDQNSPRSTAPGKRNRYIQQTDEFYPLETRKGGNTTDIASNVPESSRYVPHQANEIIRGDSESTEVGSRDIKLTQSFEVV